MLTDISFTLLISTLLGFLSGLGTGGGSLLILWLTLVQGMEPEMARSINLMFFLPCALIATIFRWKQSKPNWKLILPAAAAGILGAVRVADDMLLVCVTEQRTKEEMDKFVEIVNNI